MTGDFILTIWSKFAAKVQNYTQNLNQESFINSGAYYDATLRNLELIGEAATNIPTEIREQYPNIPWRQIIATRNRIIHSYLGIDNDIIWNIITDEIPALILDLKIIKQAHST